MSAVISGVGAALPATAVDNDTFAPLGVDEDWIVSRTGVRRRYWLAPGEQLVDLAAAASRAALADAGIEACDVDFVLAATSTPDRVSPGLAPEIAHLLGMGPRGAVDLNGACTGFLYALDYAVSRVEAGAADRILVVGADAMTRLADREDRNTAVLFGDAAGAVVVEAAGADAVCERCAPYLSFGSDGGHVRDLYVDPGTGRLRMDGGEVYANAVDSMTSELEAVLLACELELDDLDLLVCHQANARIVRSVARRLRCGPDRAVSHVDEFGNTSSASIPLALWRARQDGRVHDGHRIGVGAFGAGFTWGAGVVSFRRCAHAAPAALTVPADVEAAVELTVTG